MVRFLVVHAHLFLALLPALTAAVSGQEPAAPDAAAIERAVERGVARMIELQELDGSFRYSCAAFMPGQTSLTVYTLLKCGVHAEHQAIQRALAFLETVEAEHVYDTAMLVMMFAELDASKYRREIQKLTKRLLGWQARGFAYPSGVEDLSNTQYGALAFRAAEAAGIKVPVKAWEKIIDYVMTMGAHTPVSPGRGWAYRDDRHVSGSMTAAGVSVLAIARDALASKGRLRSRKLDAIEEEIQAGLEWLAANFTVETSWLPTNERKPQELAWRYYNLYGIERTGHLLGIDKIGTHDWYREGAAFLLGQQDELGGWNTAPKELQPNTCFALLFLRRASAPRTGEKSVRAKTYGGDDPSHAVNLRAAGDTPLRVWISSFNGTLKDGAVERVDYVLGDDTVLKSVAKSASGDGRFAAELELPGPGKWTIHARAYPSGNGDAPHDSAAIEVRVDEVLAPWMLEYARGRKQNLLLATTLDVKGSSELTHQGWRPSNVADGLQTRGWLCAPDDATPWVKVTLDKPQRANVLLLTHASSLPSTTGQYARATEVEVYVDDEDPIRVSMGADERRKTRVELGRPRNIGRIEVRILGREPGTVEGKAVGFMELELVLER
ncbi:MAG: hypothetical protein GY711_23880 [bacterium]|nr:hypothetical protein [bacterium]